MDARVTPLDIQSVSNDNPPLVQRAGGGPSACPQLSRKPQLVELFTNFRDAGAVGFALAQIPRSGRILWVQERMAALETGRPFGQALGQFGGDPDNLVLACSRNASDLLWAMEEGLRCTSISAIIGEIWGDPRALDFTATKRLATRAERQGVHVFLIRFNASPNLSAARQRWNISSLPSAPHPHDPRAPGPPRWRAELFRARDAKPGLWDASYDRAAHSLDLVSPLPGPALGETHGAHGEYGPQRAQWRGAASR